MTQLIVALDLPSQKEALDLAEMLRREISWVKVGLELFIASGPPIISRLGELEYNIFLDLKLYDIPNTVANAVKAACGLNVQMLTLHCMGGQRMCEAAVDATRGMPHSPLLLGVTVLTSFAAGEIPGVSEAPERLALQLAGDARRWGLHGIVCSAREAAEIRTREPGLKLVCPGIRPGLSGEDDQRRVMTPAEAATAGADYIVVGRPISKAACPLDAARTILDELKTAGN